MGSILIIARWIIPIAVGLGGCQSAGEYPAMNIRLPTGLPRIELGDNRASVLQKLMMLEKRGFELTSVEEYSSRYDEYKLQGNFEVLNEPINLRIRFTLSNDRLVSASSVYTLNPLDTAHYESAIGELLGVDLTQVCVAQGENVLLSRDSLFEETACCGANCMGEARGVYYGIKYSFFSY